MQRIFATVPLHATHFYTVPGKHFSLHGTPGHGFRTDNPNGHYSGIAVKGEGEKKNQNED
jgi:hypothetical protein